jgi:hypothetical protein
MSEPMASNVETLASAYRRGRRSVIASILLAVIVFICGGAAGWGVSVLWRPPLRGPMGMAPPPPVEGMVEQLRVELLLSDDQVKAAKQIYQQRHDALEAIRQKMGPELKAEYDTLDQQMKGVLTSAQYQRWSERFNSVRSRMLPPPPPGAGGPGEGMPGGPSEGMRGGPGEGPGGILPPPGMGPGGPGPEGPGGHPGPPGPPEGMPPPP